MLLICALILSFFMAQNVEAQTFEVLNRNPKVYQGEVVIVKIPDHLKGRGLQLYAFDELYPFNKNGFAFIGVSVDRKPDRYMLYLVETDGQEWIQHDFYYTHIEILEKEFGTPWYAGPVRKRGKAASKQRAKEVAMMRNAYGSANSEEDFTDGLFLRPLENNEVTDQFGTLRLYGTYNHRTKRTKVERKVPHGGVDLKAKIPLPVMAVNSGKVLLTHNFPLRGTEGKMLVIDHGSGTLSLYLHLSKFMVKTGDTVAKGQIVAKTGATPRGTPPHLHFMVKIHGTNVDPISFINDFNRYRD